jgi:hypothetical protein
MGDHLLALLRREKVATRTGMALLATAFAARAFALPLACGVETTAIIGWRLGGVPGAAALLLLQLCDTLGEGCNPSSLIQDMMAVQLLVCSYLCAARVDMSSRMRGWDVSYTSSRIPARVNAIWISL